MSKHLKWPYNSICLYEWSIFYLNCSQNWGILVVNNLDIASNAIVSIVMPKSLVKIDF